MIIKRIALATIICLCFFTAAGAQEQSIPYDLTVNLLSQTDQVFLNGYPASTPLKEATSLKENFQFTDISTTKPFFGWAVPSLGDNTLQTAYRILLASESDYLMRDSADMWDSGKIESNCSANILYEGKQLEPGKVYSWKVKIWDNNGNESVFSNISQFKTSESFAGYLTDRHPIQKQDEYPVKIEQTNNNSYFTDFGKAAFGRLRVNLFSENGTDTVKIHLGEVKKDGRVDRTPGGSRRYAEYSIVPTKGWNTYIITIRQDQRNTGSQAILIPDYIGEVTPFRYCEIENYNHPLKDKDLIRETAFYPFNETDSYFHSSDTVLNQVWELSKYSVKATSFLGVYVDGDRERIPYEADAIINQLSHYSVSGDGYNMARYTHEYLIKNPTWPTEWILQSVLIAWEDYMYTGNTRSFEQFYKDLQAKTLISLSDEDGFISTLKGKVTPEVLKSIHFDGNLRDIVDWPHTGILGLEKEEGGETDGFVFTEVNTVVNAYHYKALTVMANIAQILGKQSDYTFYTERADNLKKMFNKHLFDKKRGVYVDGIGTDHASLHANMFPLAFGLVEDKNIESVLKFIRSRGMACSVYGSQFLLDGVYDAGDDDYGLQLLSSIGERSWYNMIRKGSTISMEAWDNKYKPNQDWNHAWGAAPANLIPRKLMGIQPIEPGFKKIRIKPQPSTLDFAEVKQPTMRGDIIVKFNNKPLESFQLNVSIPGNTTADVYLPHYSRRQKVLVDGQPVKFTRDGNFAVIENVGSGNWEFTVER